MAALLTVREVAQCLRVDESTVRRWAKQGVLPAVPLPGKESSRKVTYRFRQTALSNLLHIPPEEIGQEPAMPLAI